MGNCSCEYSIHMGPDPMAPREMPLGVRVSVFGGLGALDRNGIEEFQNP